MSHVMHPFHGTDGHVDHHAAGHAHVSAAHRHEQAHQPYRLPRPPIGWVLVGVLVFLYAVREMLPPFVLATAIAYVVFPPIAWLERRLRWPRALIVGISYLVLVGLLVGAVALLVPQLINQVGQLRAAGPRILGDALQQVIGGDRIAVFGQTFTADDIVQRASAEVTDRLSGGGTVAQMASATFHYMLTLLVFFVALFYLLLDGPRVVRYPLGFLGTRRHTAEALMLRVNRAWGQFVRGQILLVGLMTLVSWVVLAFVFRLPYALALAVMTGFLEIVPLLGPILAAGIACSVALANNGAVAALWLGLAYFILRETEDQLVMPLIVGRAVHLAPVVTLFSVLAGERIAGPLGMILAIPVGAAVKVVLDVWRGQADQEAQVLDSAPPAVHDAIVADATQTGGA